MCVVNSDKGKYEVLIFDIQHHLICSVNFKSISTVCRFLDDFDFEFGDVEICKIGYGDLIDPKLLMQVWDNYFEEEL